MSHTTQLAVGRVRAAVVWPDPSPLDRWWHSIMYPGTEAVNRGKPQSAIMGRHASPPAA